MTSSTEQQEPAVEPAAPRRRRRFVVPVVVAVVALLALAAVGWLGRDARLGVDYETVSGPVRPGEEVTVRDPDGGCGPLLVTLHEESFLGFWDQTHSGNVVRGGFERDERRWWQSGGETLTPVPCALDSTATFRLPADVTASVVAACDQSNRCARITVDHGDG